ncbi:MAG: ABC transporter substrate-binding protein [Acidobacteria bacterium]|nr:ABC transporter substrate-binding protein [Acidobacteriota bacterium]
MTFKSVHRFYFFIPLALLLLIQASCTRQPGASRQALVPSEFNSLRWEEVVERARGNTVNYAMWGGDEARNRYFQGAVAEALKRKYDVTLRIVPLGDTVELINKLLNEKGAGKARNGSVDMVWINGENFRTARQAELLWGPFADGLPNIRYFDEEARARDFGTPIEGYEAPWQRAQFVLAYDTARVPDPPRTIGALGDWIRAHPGRFTYLAPPDFTGSAFIRHIFFHIGGGPRPFQTGFDEALYQRAAAATVDFLNEIKPFLWRRGETYPVTPKEQDRLFANGEIDFAMSYGPSFASERIARGEYPPTTRTFVFDDGTIGNYSFLAIPFNATNVPGALVVINHLMSPEHALDQSRVLESVFPLALDRLTEQERRATEALPRGAATLSTAELSARLLPEADAEYLERLEKDWQEKVLRR